MGEFAYRVSDGERVKIGTCSGLTDLRYDQRDRIRNATINVYDASTLAEVWFRFPWPDEDHREPGNCETVSRFMGLRDFVQPPIRHSTKQFTGHGGYLLMLPCPEDASVTRDYNVMHNGYSGPTDLIGQAWRDGRLVGMARCHGCDSIYWLDETYAAAAAEIIRAEGKRREWDGKRLGYDGEGAWYFTVADRLMVGYTANK